MPRLALAIIVLLQGGLTVACANNDPPARQFRAGAYAMNISPWEFPVIINGGMYQRTADRIVDPLHARCLVLDDGTNRIAIAVVDNCLVPRSLLDEAKRLASDVTGIPTENMLISATHTHSAPSVFGALGSDVDETYAAKLPSLIARGIEQAHKKIAPARIGWAVGENDRNVFCRRWIMKPGTAMQVKFTGKTNDQAQMNPGYQNPNAIRPIDEPDTELPLVSVQTADGKPLALLANYSMHYVGAPSVSADYFAVFAEEMAKRLDADGDFLGILSNGTSGDTNRLDFRKPGDKFDRFSVAKDLADSAFEAYQAIEYFDWVPVAMKEAELTLKVRMPSAEEVAAAKDYLQVEGDNVPTGEALPQDIHAVYARETLLLNKLSPTRKLKLQAVRIGDLAIAALPNETYTSTGRKIKQTSPIKTTFCIELANGADGYIPPPEQHKLGGYTTWRARSSCLEEEAEPKIRAKLLDLLKQVATTRRDEAPIPSAMDNGEPDAGDSSAAPPVVDSPLSPQVAIQHMHVADGFRVELVAAEPLVQDPVAFDWDLEGKLWVVEMRDYPRGLDDKGQPGGRIKILEDTNEDGRYDRATVFYDGLSFPNGIMTWREGVLVTCAPEILYLHDTNGDGRADSREVLYNGFTEGNPQLRINGLRWGLDNWIYCANGVATRGKVKSLKTGVEVDISGRDLRIRPNSGDIDPQIGKTQFGRNRDDWGDWFGTHNSKPIWHFVLADHYLRRNPHLAVDDPVVEISNAPGKATIYARSRQGKFFHESEVGRFTSANSAIVYRDPSFAPQLANNCFVSEPVHNLIHREVMQRDGTTYSSRRNAGERRSEFLASEDTWFRPTMLRTGPDGAIWFADMYREILDHPEYIPKERRQGLGFRAGDSLGRIYRIVPADKPLRKMPHSVDLPAEGFARLLEHPNGTFRDLIHRAIVSERTTACIPTMIELFKTSESPATRMQAMCLLDGLTSLTPEMLARGLADRHWAVRRQAVRLSEKRWRQIDGDQPLAIVSTEDHAAVQLQLACSVDSPTALAELITRSAQDIWIQTAVLSSLHEGNLVEIFSALDQLAPQDRNLQVFWARATALAARMKHRDAMLASLRVIGKTAGADERQSWRTEVLGHIAQHTRVGKVSIDPWLNELRTTDPAAAEAITQTILAARRTLADRSASIARRLEALRLIGLQMAEPAAVERLLVGLLTPREPHAMQAAAASAIMELIPEQAPDLLLSNWRSFTPKLRGSIIPSFLQRADWIRHLFRRIEAGELSANDIGLAHRQSLIEHRDAGIRDQARAIFAQHGQLDRAEVLAQFASVDDLPGSRERGASVFKQHCASCHRVGGIGNVVGPDLAALSDKSTATLLTALLDPNQSVEERYASYIVITEDGLSFTGILAAESGASVTLIDVEGKRHVISRADIDELQATGRSIMPEGFERQLKPPDVADLFTLLRTGN